ncbi:D-alanyl-D-alanine carboxypeptidase family protein [Rubritalea tangerina]|uniref:D-alanyl-D-alanine carboxypeptidase family protein n=1 Tax=Rubritalea tangerina TaxID=430798 RepID=A0ABW4ZCQ2_9BACT
MIRTLLSIILVGSFLLPKLEAQTPESYIVLERHSRKVLLASGSEYRRPIAGLAHMATAKVALDWAKAAGVSSATMIAVPNHSYYSGVDNPLSLQAGDQLSIRDALYATILGQDSVAATSLAHHVGGQLLQRRQLSGDPIAVFVNEMNNLGRSLGMNSTRFTLPSGADTQKRSNYSTASDIARLSVALSTDTAYGFYAKQKQRSLRVVKRDGRTAQLTVINSNKLLSSKLKISGLKAGYSPMAAQCASVLANRHAYVEKLADGGERVTPVQLIVVVLGSADSAAFVEHVIPQGWSHYEAWRNGGYMATPDRREFLKLPQAQ